MESNFYSVDRKKQKEEYNHTLNDIKNMYSIIIDDFDKLSNLFDFNNPVEIYAMYIYLIKKGYLSNNGKIDCNEQMMFDNKKILGVDVINGHGFCRHYASFLRDIYNKKNYDNNIFLGTRYYPNLDIKYNKKMSREELVKIINDNVVSKQFSDLLVKKVNETNGNMAIDVLYKLRKPLYVNITGNHVINRVISDDKVYYFDSFFSMPYAHDKGLKFIGEKNNIMIEHFLFFLDYNSLSDIKTVIHSFKLQKSGLNDYFEIVDKTTKICDSNKDLLLNFYNDNKDNYNEIHNKIKEITF